MNANEFDVHDLTDAIGGGVRGEREIYQNTSGGAIENEGLKFDFEVKRRHSDSHRSSAQHPND